MKVRALGDAGKQRELHLPRGKDVSNPKSAPGKKETGIRIPKNKFSSPQKDKGACKHPEYS